MIPRANQTNLMLKNAVVEAVQAGRFHIYAVAEVTQGIEILTGVAAGVPDAEGLYPPDSVYGRIQQKLQRFVERGQALKQVGGIREGD
jgi:predicted ATP-dependent protease